MSISCLSLIDELVRSIDITNLELTDNMTSQTVNYNYVCIKPNLTYEYYYQRLREYWDDIINNFIHEPKCTTAVSKLAETYEYITPERIAQAKKIFNSVGQNNDHRTKVDIDNIVLDVIASNLMAPEEPDQFRLNENFVSSLVNLTKILFTQCQCQAVDIFRFFIKKYKRVYHKKLDGKTKNQVIEIIRSDYQKFKTMVKNLNQSQTNMTLTDFFDRLAGNFTGLYGFSVDNELERLIPEELGSLKQFFIKVISTYYSNLHPIVWAQIFKAAAKNFFIDLPYTQDEIFAFVSKQLLLNSGPFILKTLQMIRPVLTPKLAAKYNLTKLKYPLLKPEQINLMLSKAVYHWDMYRILENYSASVGHVSKVILVTDPTHPFIIKMIKPVTVAQSCWEYNTLSQIYPAGSCEQEFIINLLQSNGRELNVQNERKNINDGHRYYTENYKQAFSVDINAKLTTLQNIDNIIIPDCWYALAVTLSPGIPLSKLIENNLVEKDTKYRAKLHRCLDILVYKFFQNIVRNGFYHGDLHSGNIFYSYELNQMTLIDFGAVGRIDIYSDDPSIFALLDIIVMSIFNNFDGLFDRMTELLNTKCVETQVNMANPDYQKLKQELYQDRIKNIQCENWYNVQSKIYKHDIFSNERISQERNDDIQQTRAEEFRPNHIQSIYSYLEHQPKSVETIIESRDDLLPDNSEDLPPFTNVQPSPTISFAQVLEKIIKFYAMSGVNIAIKFSEFYEFQKAYVLLLGVLHKVDYDSYRTAIAISRAIINFGNIPKLLKIKTVAHVVKSYLSEKKKYRALKKQLNIEDNDPNLDDESLGKNSGNNSCAWNVAFKKGTPNYDMATA